MIASIKVVADWKSVLIGSKSHHNLYFIKFFIFGVSELPQAVSFDTFKRIGSDIVETNTGVAMRISL